MNSDEVKAVCRNCGKPGPAEKFVLDYKLKIMVCPTCIADMKKKAVKPVVSEEKKLSSTKPKDWDADDEYLAKLNKKKPGEVPKPVFTKIDDFKIKYPCSKCKYVFVYNLEKNHPRVCPYCRTPVSGVQ